MLRTQHGEQGLQRRCPLLVQLTPVNLAWYQQKLLWWPGSTSCSTELVPMLSALMEPGVGPFEWRFGITALQGAHAVVSPTVYIDAVDYHQERERETWCIEFGVYIYVHIYIYIYLYIRIMGGNSDTNKWNHQLLAKQGGGSWGQHGSTAMPFGKKTQLGEAFVYHHHLPPLLVGALEHEWITLW